MDQSSHNNESAPFKLPEVQPAPRDITPGFEAGGNNKDDSSISKAIEQNKASSAISSNPPAQSPTAVNPSLVIDDLTSSIPSVGSTKKIVITDNLPANDADLIEKAWVIKAKAIVEKTKNNPFEQSNEIKKIRVDYQNKRFNSNLKIDKE